MAQGLRTLQATVQETRPHVLPGLNGYIRNEIMIEKQDLRAPRNRSKKRWLSRVIVALLLLIARSGEIVVQAANTAPPEVISALLKQACIECHNANTTEGGLDLTTLAFDLNVASTRDHWIRIHGRVENREMPPTSEDLPAEQRVQLVQQLATAIHTADAAEISQQGRGPIRRLNRDEYQQNLRDILNLPTLDIRDILPEDREGHHFNKTTDKLDMSRVQLAAYLNAAETSLQNAIASGVEAPAKTSYRAVGTKLFSSTETFGTRPAMFFVRDSKFLPVDGKQFAEFRKTGEHDPDIELALFRSAHWPYFGYPQDFVAPLTGEYRVRFSARSVLQWPNFELTPAVRPVPMTFRARKPSGADVSGDVRATGGVMDVQPEINIYETTVFLKHHETFEYSLLGLPVPLARNVDNGPPTYRYPPLPIDGQPGVAFQWLEVEGPIVSETWPPPSHHVLFDKLAVKAASSQSRLPVEVVSESPHKDARRLLNRFIQQAAREPVSEDAIQQFERLIFSRLDQNLPFAEAMLTGYKAFLCSGHLLYLHEPQQREDHFAIASRLSHFLSNTRPDAELMSRAKNQQLRDTVTLRTETDRLIHGERFDQFVKNFTDYWLNLRQLYRDEPDIRLYPEYRFDAWLLESMEQETVTFFTAMVRENLPAKVLIDANFVFANERLATHYNLPPLSGSMMRKVALEPDSPYGGLLTQAAILKVTANGTTTSPIVRGAWIMDRLIGQPPPPPPASVPAVEPDIRGATTIRELLQRHTSSESCSACHARFDPVGLALENFDVLGGWRNRYRSIEQGEEVTGIDRAGHNFAFKLATPVDASGELLDGRIFQNIRELKQLLAADSRQLAKNFLHQFTVYATGTPVRFSDRTEIESILDTIAADGYRVQDLLHAFVQSQIFLGPAGCQ